VVNVEVISLDDAPQGYKQFGAGIPTKFVIDPHASIPRRGATLSELGAQRDLAAAHA
jgi:hypothetical protein